MKPVVGTIRMCVCRTQTPICWFLGIWECWCSAIYGSFGEVLLFLVRVIFEIECVSELARLVHKQTEPPSHPTPNSHLSIPSFWFSKSSQGQRIWIHVPTRGWFHRLSYFWPHYWASLSTDSTFAPRCNRIMTPGTKSKYYLSLEIVPLCSCVFVVVGFVSLRQTLTVYSRLTWNSLCN